MAPNTRAWAIAVLFSCTLLVCIAQPVSSQPKLAQPDYSVYLKKNELLKRVEDLVAAHTDIMKIEIRHAQDGDYKADLQVVTLEPGGLSPSHTTKARLLMDFGEHGREFITSEVGLRFMQVITDPEMLQEYAGNSSKKAQRIQAILKHSVFKILPMENVNGRDLVENGQLCERKNGRGVDTNRNFDIDWGKKEKDYDPREEFPGKAPHSEPETQIILALAKELQPHTWLNVHSGMYALFTPYDHKAGVPNTTDARAALRMLQRIKELSCPRCVVGSGGRSVGYLAHGTGTDYMFEKLGVPMSFTWEIYGDEKASFEDCFRMFNPLVKEEFERVVTLWVNALLHLVELLPTHPATWPLFRRAGLDRVGDGGEQQQQQQQQQQPATGTPSSNTSDAAAATADQKAEQQQQPDQSETNVTTDSSSSSSSKQQQQPGQDSSTIEVESNSGDDQDQEDSDQEEHIQIVHRIPPAERRRQDQSLLGAFSSRSVIPLLLGLAGMGVVLYYATRPSNFSYSKVSRERSL